MNIRLSKVDEARFNIRVARAYCTTPDEVDAAILDCKKYKASLLILRIPTSSQNSILAIERGGGQLTDTLLYYERTSDHVIPSSQSDRTLKYRLADLVDAPSIEALALEAFNGYPSHYGNDPRLSSINPNTIYADWACSCLKSKSPTLLVESNSSILGFASLKQELNGDLDVALLAVNPIGQRRGLALGLLHEAVNIATKAKVRRLTYSTQISNITMQRVLGRAQFFPFKSDYTFHWWTDRN